ncbi:MAG: hypothetical protein FJW40_17080 [Acidobacteria bacterium]|nr:hypothetical protein [Acidobacteriota bacterium]
MVTINTSMKLLHARTLSATILVASALIAQTRTLTIVPAASYSSSSGVAPESIAAAFGENLAGAATVTVTDSRGTARPATVFAATPTQVNFLIPAGTATGSATVIIAGNATGSVDVRSIAPGLFSANGSGRGLVAATTVRIAPNGNRTEGFAAQADANRGLISVPLDLTPENGQIYLSLYGSGLRGGTRFAATINGENVPVLAAAAQGAFAGLDQVNIGPLPPSLRNRDEAEIALSADGIAANRVTVSVLSVPTTGWGRRADLPEANSEMSVTELDGKIYVLGGYPQSRVSVRTVQVYDPITNTWRITTPLPVALNHTMAASVNGKLYLIGGQPGAGGAGPFVDTVYEFDPTSAQWRTRAPMPTARGGGAASVWNGKIYVAGGRPPRGADFAVYDPATNTWRTLPDLPTQRNHLGAATIAGKIYVIGGRFEAGFQSPQSDRIEIFDPATNSWTARAPMPHPRGGINVAEAFGCLHVFGGEGDDDSPTGVHPDHDIYNPVTDRWISMPAMPTPVHGVTGAVFANGLVYLPGGGTMIGGSSGSMIHQVYRPTMSCRP